MVWSILWKRGRATRSILRDRVTIILLDTVESPSVLKGIAEQILFRLPPDHEITIHTRVPTMYDLRYVTPPSPRLNPGMMIGSSPTMRDFTILPDSRNQEAEDRVPPGAPVLSHRSDHFLLR